VSPIPEQPRWRPLRCDDKFLLDRYCQAFAPYAEATLATLLVWNKPGGCHLAQLNGNVVIRHETSGGLPVVTVLGASEPVETARALLEREGFPLRRVPSYSLGKASEASWAAASLRVIPDRDNDDYVFDTVRLADLAGQALKGKRKRRNAFAREHKPESALLDLTSATDAAAVVRCANTWFHELEQYRDDLPVQELRGVEHLLDLTVRGELDGLLGFGVRVNGELIAASIVETHGTDTVSGVVFKATRDLPGSFEYLRSSSAATLAAMGYRRINAQQDLGRAGLRQMKTAYRPVTMLRKWTIEPWREEHRC
jgi:uncharacterized protein